MIIHFREREATVCVEIHIIPQPWWPKRDEEWLPLLDYKKDLGQPPYKKSYDLKKRHKKLLFSLALLNTRLLFFNK
jgi:hypothetical protein